MPCFGCGLGVIPKPFLFPLCLIFFFFWGKMWRLEKAMGVGDVRY